PPPEAAELCPIGVGLSFKATYSKEGELNALFCTRDGVYEGPAKTWYPGKKIESSGSYAKGELTGLWTRWHENAAKKDEGRWENGVPVGIWKNWYDDGKPKASGRMDEGEPACEWTYWDKAGVETMRWEKRTVICPDLSTAPVVRNPDDEPLFRTEGMHVFV